MSIDSEGKLQHISSAEYVHLPSRVARDEPGRTNSVRRAAAASGGGDVGTTVASANDPAATVTVVISDHGAFSQRVLIQRAM